MNGTDSLFEQFHFLRPMGLLAAIPMLIVWWYCVRSGDLKQNLSKQISPHLLKHLIVKPEHKSRVQPAGVLLGIWLLGTVALAGPSWRQEPSPFTQDESNLWLLLKLTPSMESDDLLPSRLERVRNKMHDLMQLRDGSATGLIVYSESAHLVMPPTNDRGLIDQMLQSIDPSMMPGEGDALPEALALAADHIERDAVSASILVIADAAESSEMSALDQWRSAHQVTVQWLVPIGLESDLIGLGIEDAANRINARVVRITPDDADIDQVVRRAASSLVASTTDPSAQWRDEGYWLLWPITMGAAFWSRRGWSVAPRNAV